MAEKTISGLAWSSALMCGVKSRSPIFGHTSATICTSGFNFFRCVTKSSVMRCPYS